MESNISDSLIQYTTHSLLMCFLKVYTEGRLIVEFNFDDLLRIRSWHFAIRNHRELIPRSVIAMQVTIIYVSEHGGNGGGIVDCHGGDGGDGGFGGSSGWLESGDP